MYNYYRGKVFIYREHKHTKVLEVCDPKNQNWCYSIHNTSTGHYIYTLPEISEEDVFLEFI